DEGVDWVPYEADDDAGIGRQLSVVDVNNDGLLDMVMGGMKGAHVLTHHVENVSKETWEAAQPKPYDGEQPPATDEAEARRGPKSAINADTGSVPEAIEAESLAFEATAGRAEPQSMAPFAADHWSGDSQIWWTGARPGDSLTLDLPPFTGTIDLEVVLTCARDYGIVQLSLDDQVLGEPIDLYEKQVVTTGVLDFEKIETKGRKHTLTLQLVGANPRAQQAFMAAVDYVRIKQADGTYVAGNATERSEESDAPDVFLAKSVDGQELKLDFESGLLDDWTATGDAFVGQPIQGDVVSQRREDMQSAHAGEYWIGGFERIGDAGTGTLTSQPFVVSHPYASFLANGGQHSETRVELVLKDTGAVIYAANGENSETMRQVVADLRAYLGREIMIRLVDDYQGGWGHLNFDHFRFHESPPGPVDAPIVVLVDDQYPHAGLDAEAAAEAMRLPEGFSVTVGAAEPEVQQPIAMAIDDRGRVWIAEAFEYPVRAEGEQGRDRILIFEDTDGDGRFDKRKVFTDDLIYVSGIEVGHGGVWVGSVPNFYFIPDRDGDDVPDGPAEIIRDGWGGQDQHETLNTFTWGPDG
ncbi:MAG: hypothetical protein KDA61_23280, partial [Planctomycetales bacterium]|nr:hypothetical protein [Planctomycetales bacterium]